MRFPLAVLLVMSVAGCAHEMTSWEALQSWVGASGDRVKTKFGNPEVVALSDPSVKLWRYTIQSQNRTGPTYMPTMATSQTNVGGVYANTTTFGDSWVPGQVYATSCTLIFTMRDDRVQKADQTGNGCSR